MGKPTGFLDHPREAPPARPVDERLGDFREVYGGLSREQVHRQGARCMDCGVPFCHTGCPLHNLIPDWNDLAHRDRLAEAFARLEATNNFPEITGRICPAPCEAACVVAIHAPAVAIKGIERAIADFGIDHHLVVPRPSARPTGRRVAVVGSGPAGLAAAQQLARSGHAVTVFEKTDRLGGLLRYGIPDFKLDKAIVDRRIAQLEAEGVTFRTRVEVGIDLPLEALRRDVDAVLLAVGAETAREVPVPGRELAGVHPAMDYLVQQNRRLAGDRIEPSRAILATGRRVVIVGGGDTGADCLGTALRQGAASVVQLQIHPEPPAERAPETPWPRWPYQLRLESSHEEGGVREWGVATLRFEGDADGRVCRLHAARVGPGPRFERLDGGELVLDAELVLLAIGFHGVARPAPLARLGVTLDPRERILTGSDYATAVPGVFAAGDARRGASLVVWAIAEGRRAAASIERYLAVNPR